MKNIIAQQLSESTQIGGKAYVESTTNVGGIETTKDSVDEAVNNTFDANRAAGQ